MHAGIHACWDSCMPGFMHAGIHACWDSCMMGFMHAGIHACWMTRTHTAFSEIAQTPLILVGHTHNVYSGGGKSRKSGGGKGGKRGGKGTRRSRYARTVCLLLTAYAMIDFFIFG